jgi:hypothetical protein
MRSETQQSLARLVGAVSKLKGDRSVRHRRVPGHSAPDSVTALVSWLNGLVPFGQAPDESTQRAWEYFGFLLHDLGYLRESLEIFRGLYHRLQEADVSTSRRHHKTLPLLGISRCCESLEHRSAAKRFAMLALCEEAAAKRPLDTRESVYARVLELGVDQNEARRYARLAADGFVKSDPKRARFPEWLLQQLPDEWADEIPTSGEMNTSLINPLYAKYLLDWSDRDRTGQALEYLAQYLFSVIPGCRTKLRARTHSTELDVLCSLNGLPSDFRSLLGRYVVCECKNWRTAADVTTVGKFASVLRSSRCRLGVLFSRNGLSGAQRSIAATRDQFRFAQQGIYILVVSEPELLNIVRGQSLLALLRQKYEQLRFDLQPTPVYE